MLTGNHSKKNLFGWICIAVAPIIYYVYLAQHSLDVPNADDFVVILNYLLKYDSAVSWQEKWHELTFEFLEHRLVFTRLVSQLIRAVLGTLDLRWVMFIGNLSLLGVAGLLYRTLRINGLSVWYLLPVMLCLFQPLAYESHFWAIASTNYMPVCLLAMLSFYGIGRVNRPGLVIGWLMALIATYTFANGLVVWPIGLLMLLLTRRWRAAMLWFISMILITVVYYHNHNYHLQPSMADNLRERLPTVMANFFLLLGAAFNTQDALHPINKSDLPAYGAGVSIALSMVAFGLTLALSPWIPEKLRLFPRLTRVKNSAFLWATMLFLLLSSIAFGIGRSNVLLITADSRYRDFPVFAMAMLYCVGIVAINPVRQRWLLGIATGLGLFFSISSYAVYTPRLLDKNASLIAGAYNWHHNRTWLIYQGTSYFSQVTSAISEQVEKNATDWYHIHDYFSGEPSMAPGKIAPPTLLSPQFAYWRLPVDPVGPNQPYFWLRTDSRVYLLPVRRLTSLTNWLRTGRSLGHYFIADFDYSHTLLPGRYDTRLYLAPAHQLVRFSPDLVLNVR